jgi:hypothetical protein
MFTTILAIILGLLGLLVMVAVGFALILLIEASSGRIPELDDYDLGDDDLLDEEHHIRPLLGVVHPKEK